MSLNVKVYNQEGKEVKDLSISEAVFAIKPKKSVLHQVFNAMLANTREPWADTKNKGEVSGGGKKPWKQKGTGRARHGSIRSPLWKGGGVTFGPLTSRNYKQKINQKMKAVATRMCLTDKVAVGHFLVVESLPADGKSKTLVALRKALAGSGKSTMILTPGMDKNIIKAASNLTKLKVQIVKDVNVVDLLNNLFVITTPEGVQILEKRLTK
ncbi:MAG: 50S ribosomal protein L4 [Candidatus Magasanikbacteria bacterium GW2011_GWC2_37_14]|uniref:Large ribosomal subunit protein uL4 n=1 Tax=Candidatus Magasanikbacteria bacterium GW2011_GWC2_37_14 TaxID=1619046 RepID=A0A0G0GLV3_9BACT|nr:MAG: 50S ribosomal protein L4 [Candidatus Magasanikbacteria bacterium GW2011_GWC2_37_14]